MRTRALTTLTLGALLASGMGIAQADDISNNIDTSIDAVAEVMPLNVGGANGSTTLYVDSTNGDGKNGCNLTGSTTLTLALGSSNSSVATVSPSSVTFTSCGDTKALTITPVAAGSATITASQTSNNTGGSFNLSPVTFTVNVVDPAPANTAPSVTVAGVTGGASYNKGSVPAATCNVTDAEDGPSSFAATLSAVTGDYSSDGLGSQTASCSYTDRGGLTVSASETYSIVDPSGPVIGYTLDPASPDGLNGWYKGNVSLDWSVSEPQSPNSLNMTGCVDQTITADQAATTYSCSATSAGGSADEQSVTIKRDGTAPLVSYTSAAGTEGSNGWYTSDVTATFTGTDILSGPASATKTATSSGEGSAVTVSSPAFTDNAGNTTAADAASKTFKIDKSAPTAPTASVNPTPNAAGWNNDTVTVHFASNGDIGPSGVDSCTADVVVELETAHEPVSGTCTDKAGNTSAPTSVSVKLDKTGPAVNNVVSLTGTLGSNNWYTTDVGVTFTATDNLSGPATASQTVTSTGEGDAITVSSPAFTDNADNTTNAGAVTKSYKVDKTNPTASFDSSLGSVHFGSVPAQPTCTSADAVSGPDGCTVTGYSGAVGTHTLTATAKDNAGRTGTATQTYTVLPWTAKGFYQPVDMNGVFNTVKGGSTVPVKFELFAGSTELTATDIVTMSAKSISCTTAMGEDMIEVLATGSTVLRYDTTGGQYVYNWKTPIGAGKCYALTMTAADGSTLTANFKMK